MFIFAGEGNTDEAFAWFDLACQERSNYMIYLAVEPSLDVIRDDPRYLGLAAARWPSAEGSSGGVGEGDAVRRVTCETS